jgi:type IV pilus assembly protein PilV
MTRVASFKQPGFKQPGFKQSGFIRRAAAPGKMQRGVALLEVLIAFFVLSIGLLGLAGMQIKALQFNQASFQRSQAMISAYDMLDRMRLNQAEATGGNYDMAWGNSSSGSGVVGDDLSQWLDTISSNFPDGQGSIECDANDICTVGVRWRDRFGANPGTDWESLAISSQL